jgi:AcrR family transcriptional regulator
MVTAATAAKSERAGERSEGVAESTRDRILEVAEELIALHGMEGFQLKDVAERVGIRPPSIFAHFRSREAVGEAVALHELEQSGHAFDDEDVELVAIFVSEALRDESRHPDRPDVVPSGLPVPLDGTTIER